MSNSLFFIFILVTIIEHLHVIDTIVGILYTFSFIFLITPSGRFLWIRKKSLKIGK